MAAMNLYYNGDSYFESLMMDYIFGLAVFYKQIVGFTNCIVGGYTKKEKEHLCSFFFLSGILNLNLLSSVLSFLT